MIDAHLRRLRRRDSVSSAEEEAIRRAIGEVRDLPGGRVLIREGDPVSASTLLLKGWMCRYKDLEDGKRQITELQIAGDFVDLHGFSLKRLDHNVMTITASRVAFFPHENLRKITEEFPHLTRLYWFLTTVDAAVHREWELSLGRRSALSRVAHVFCEMRARLEAVELSQPDEYDFPLTQIDLADCVGLTSIHVNRMLRSLREDGLIELGRSRVSILDRRRLEELAGFDPNYLYLEPMET